ncbi:MAG TPA: DUF2310 family Zn-ribbon-containing protein [Phycisphaerales bacterium]|nr:DUF2310 family Zn-ribbon-containing protein [Phycisphaerales bacterium]
MYHLKVTVGPPLSRRDGDELDDCLQHLAHAWWLCGQSLSPDVAWVLDGRHRITTAEVPALERSSLSVANAGVKGRKLVRRVREITGKGPAVQVLGRPLFGRSLAASLPEGTTDALNADPCTSRRPLVMFTHAYTLLSALRCSRCFRPVPLYRLTAQANGPAKGLEEWQLRWLLTWQTHFRMYDTIWFNSGAGERAAFRALSQLSSEFNKNGLSLRESLEDQLGPPVYYYLWSSTIDGDELPEERPCPSCGREWLTRRNVFTRFRHRCDHCRLVTG